MTVRLAPPHRPPCPLPLPRCGRGRGRGWFPSPSPLASLRSHTGRGRGEGGLLTFVLAPPHFPPCPFTLSHGARKGGGWPPYLRPWPPSLSPLPPSSPTLRERKGERLVPLTFPPAPLRSHTGRGRGEGGLLTFVLVPSPSPLAPSSPTLRERKGERLVPLTFPPGLFTLSHGARKGGGWPPYLRPGPLTFPPAPFLSYAAGEEGGEVGPPHAMVARVRDISNEKSGFLITLSEPIRIIVSRYGGYNLIDVWTQRRCAQPNLLLQQGIPDKHSDRPLIVPYCLSRIAVWCVGCRKEGLEHIDW